MMEERGEQHRIVVDDLSNFERLCFEMLDILRNEVRHVNVLHHLVARILCVVRDK